MDDEIDYNLSREQWETLKTLRSPVSLSTLTRTVLEDLAALGLVSVSDDLPVMTPKGRKALIRGSSRLWDVAA
jgi:ribosomal protein S19E (S16A)